MSMPTTKPDTDTVTEPDTALVRCAIPHAGPHGTFSYDDRVRASHPAVSTYPDAFVTDDLPKSEWPSVYDRSLGDMEAAETAAAAERQARFEARAATNRVTVTAAATMTCTRDFAGWHNGEPCMIAKGSTAAAIDPLVLENPDCWRAS